MTHSKFATVDRARGAYRVQGQGPAIVLVNGAGDSDMHWGSVIPQLAAHRTVVTLDYSGTGETTGDGSALSLPTPARQVAAVAQAAGFERFDPVGHSLGAAVAVSLASERIRAVAHLHARARWTTGLRRRRT
jgi:3-oxoadipate enol-lactonase